MKGFLPVQEGIVSARQSCQGEVGDEECSTWERCASCLPHAGTGCAFREAVQLSLRMGLSECHNLPLCLRISFRTAAQELRINPCFLRCDGTRLSFHAFPPPRPRSSVWAQPRTGASRNAAGPLARRPTVEPIYPRGRTGASACACVGGPRGLLTVCVAASRAAGERPPLRPPPRSARGPP